MDVELRLVGSAEKNADQILFPTLQEILMSPKVNLRHIRSLKMNLFESNAQNVLKEIIQTDHMFDQLEFQCTCLADSADFLKYFPISIGDMIQKCTARHIEAVIHC